MITMIMKAFILFDYYDVLLCFLPMSFWFDKEEILFGFVKEKGPGSLEGGSVAKKKQNTNTVLD